MVDQARRIAENCHFDSVRFGVGVVLHGDVQIGAGTLIGDYCVIGRPSVDDVDSDDGLEPTSIGANVVIGSHVVIHNGSQLSDDVKVYDRVILGPECSIGCGSRILYAAQVHWKVRVGSGCVVGGFSCDRSVIEDEARMFGSLVHRFDDPFADWESEEPSPVIRRRAVVGFGALVIGDVMVNEGAYVAAGAIVTRMVPAGQRVLGVTRSNSTSNPDEVADGK